MNINPARPLPPHVIKKAKELFDNKDSVELVRLLIENTEIFPIKDSYVGFLKADPTAIEKNPHTTKRIAERLYSLGFDKMITEASRPIETNRQIGVMFKSWFLNLGYPCLNESQILTATSGINVLKGSDKVLADFAGTHLGCKLDKGIDLVAKINKQYVIGEAKFLTTSGGEQGGGFRDAFSVVTETSGKAKRIAVVDGFVWLEKAGGSTYKTIVGSEKDIMSSLVLNDYLVSLK
jgi:hypothetical protein